MAQTDPRGGERPGRLGYLAAIFASALGHAAILALIFILLPALLRSDITAPPSYTVKIVDSIPAGELGTHLPPLAGRERQQPKHSRSKEPEKPESKIIPPEPELDKNVIALNSKPTPTPTPTPPPAPESPAPPPKRHHERKPTPELTPAAKRSPRPRPGAQPSVLAAKSKPTPTANVKEQLAKLRAQLMAEHLAEQREKPAAPDSDTGPVLASNSSAGAGYGIGRGTGSAGIQQDPEFLLYYRTVQDRIKKAWSFAGGSRDLTTEALFAVDATGQLTGVKIVESSRDDVFDDSVIRAIRRAAPFPPPPEKYRSQFAQGVQAVFKLGELQS